jgi:hypothetical protein
MKIFFANYPSSLYTFHISFAKESENQNCISESGKLPKRPVIKMLWYIFTSAFKKSYIFKFKHHENKKSIFLTDNFH